MGLYLIKVCFFQIAFGLIYYYALRNQTFFSVNRFYLLAALLVSFLLPLFQLTVSYEISAVNQLSDLVPFAGGVEKAIRLSPKNGIEGFQFDFFKMFYLIYLSGVILLTLRFIYNFYKIYQFKSKYELIEMINETRIFRIFTSQPFSFFNHVYIPKRLLNTAEYEKVITHEMHHVRQKHTYDRVLINFITTLLWFNPFIYLFKKWLIEVHEFEADAAVIAYHGEKLHYQMSLVNIVSTTRSSSFVSFFNFSITKRRIKMMNQKRSNKSAVLRIALIVPVTVILCVLFSFKSKHNLSFEHMGTLNNLNSLFKETPIDNIPSIFPIDTDSLKTVYITSAFGMRPDPIDKIKKMHRGIDIKAKKGTPVIATADGTIELVKYQPSGYGKFILIEHGNIYQTKYAQLESYIVKTSDQVKQGDVIGYVGSSGRSTAPHLHYEVYKDGKVVDPMTYISNYKPAK